jgi:hypothetical protein
VEWAGSEELAESEASAGLVELAGSAESVGSVELAEWSVESAVATN